MGIGGSSQEALQHNTGEHPGGQINDVVLNNVLPVLLDVQRSFLNIPDGLVAEFLNFVSDRFDEVKVESSANDLPFALPFLALAEGDAASHGPHNRC